MRKNKKLCKKILIFMVSIYAIFTLVNQQKTISQYSQNTEELKAEIENQNEYKEELAKQKDDVNSLEFIEKTAREKLDMYYPNEKIYIDKGI